MEKELLIIDSVTDLFIKNNEYINKIYFDAEQNCAIISCELNKINETINSINIKGELIEIKYEDGPTIKEYHGDLIKEPPLDSDLTQGILGGLACGIVGSNSYGTVTMTVGTFEYEASNLKCRERPSIISNNHVLVKPVGTRIWVGNVNNQVANRTCYLPFSRKDINVDLALGKLDSFNLNGKGKIFQIGDWKNIVKVSVGGSIKKYGARSGYTSGNTTRITNIKVGNRWFRHIYETSRDFGCPGDSGSAVLDGANNWIGVYSWGEDLGENTCSKHPKGYFWAVDYRSQFLDLIVNIKDIIKDKPNT